MYAGTGAMAPGQSLLSVWIGKIGTGVSDRTIRAALELIGGLAGWKRTSDQKTGTQKTFGFAEFFSAGDALSAKSLLNDAQLGDSRLLVKIDEKTQKIIDDWARDNVKEGEKNERNIVVGSQIRSLFHDATVALGVPILPSSSSSSLFGPSNSSSIPTPTDTKEENPQMEAASSSSALPSSTPSSEPKTGSHPKLDSKSEVSVAARRLMAAEKRREEEKKRDLDRKQEIIDEDRDRELKRLEKNEKLCLTIERELEADQREREASLERRRKSDEESRILREEDLKAENTLLWGEGDEAQEKEAALRRRLMSTEFVKARQREAEQDRLDREAEEAELRAEMRRAEERHKEQVLMLQEEQAARLKAERERMNVDAKRQPPPSPSRLPPSPSYSQSLPMNDKKRHSTTNSELDLEASAKRRKEEESQDRILLTSLQTSQIESKSSPISSTSQEIQTSNGMIGSSPGSKTAALNAKIPSDSTALFSMPIRWDLLQSNNVFETTLKSWVTKKMIEYLEVEEPTMIRFICTHIQEHKPPQELIAQLQPVLDDDTEVFVITLWRLLALESLKLESSV